MVNKIHLLKCGKINMDQSVLLSGRGYGTRRTCPVFAFLLDTSDGYVLIDTGLIEEGVDSPETAWGPRAKLLQPLMTREDRITSRLNELGVQADDIRMVINTHMHWDHTGGNRLFKKAIFVEQRSEYRFAFAPDSSIGASYMSNHITKDAEYMLVEGDCEVAEGIRVIQTPGHTPGHQSVIVSMADGGGVIIAGDAVYAAENLEKMIGPGNCWSSEHAMLSLNKLKTISELTGYPVIPSHDYVEGFTESVEQLLDELNDRQEGSGGRR